MRVWLLLTFVALHFGLTTNLQDFIKLVEMGLDHYSYDFQPLLSAFTMPIFAEYGDYHFF